MSHRLCLLGPREGVAGPAGFQRRFVAGVEKRGHDVTRRLEDLPYDAILISGGTRQLSAVRRAQKNGIRVVQRLDGMNWIHRRARTGLRHFLRAEINNLLLRATRRAADVVVYQSQFVRDWWERAHGPANGAALVIHNGVPLDVYAPEGPRLSRGPGVRIVVVEANLAGGYEIGLMWAADLARRVRQAIERPLELAVAGRVAGKLRDELAADPITWLGLIPPEDIPALNRSADVLFASDLHPACPNAVIEALACGLPVVGFETGALREVVGEEA
ncbi:MAG TPA: glycosyltransferase family 4 protein, partial [Anaerolineales bacterium]|nr:glycosyltransferase family 4 protein [Anaerolineales bacterium]